MQTISATEAKQRLATLLDAAQREPVIIRRQRRDVAVVMSYKDFSRLRGEAEAEFDRFCDMVGQRATERGLTEARLNGLLTDDGD